MILKNADPLLTGLTIGYTYALGQPLDQHPTHKPEITSQAEKFAQNLQNEDYIPVESHLMTIVGTLYKDDPVQLKQTAIACSPTPADQTAYTAIATMTALAQRDIPLSDWFSKIWEVCGGQDEDFDSTFRKIGHVLGWGSQHHAMRHLGTDETANQMATIALYSILRHPDDIQQALDCASIASHNKIQLSMLVGAIGSLNNLRKEEPSESDD